MSNQRRVGLKQARERAVVAVDKKHDKSQLTIHVLMCQVGLVAFGGRIIDFIGGLLIYNAFFVILVCVKSHDQ